MADPLRRTLLAKLRGKKSKKGSSAGGGYGSATAANGCREGKEKVLQKKPESCGEHSVVLFAGLDCTLADRMSAYDNCYVDGAVNIEGCIVHKCKAVLQSALRDCEASTTHVNSSRGEELRSSRGPTGWHRVNEELPGVPLQRATLFEGEVKEADRTDQGPYCAGQVVTPVAEPVGGPHAQKKHIVRVPRQYSVGDSIGFGDNHISLHTKPSEPNIRFIEPTDCQFNVPRTNGTELCLEKHQSARSNEGTGRCFRLRHMADSVVAVSEHANSHAINIRTETNSVAGVTQMYPRSFLDYPLSGVYTEENILIRNIESYGSSLENSGDIRVPNLQSPTFFPKELEFCEINVAPLCSREGSSLRHHLLDSEEEDYYDNEILPFYGINENESKGDGDKVPTSQTEIDNLAKRQSNGDSAQETDRLRSQLKEAYYLLINAMHDISLDSQQLNGCFIDHTSSSTSHSRDSLCSRLSAKNLDSDSWSSGGDHSPQQVSDTDSLLLYLCSKGGKVICKSLQNLLITKIRPALLRSASDGAIRYHDWPSRSGHGPGFCVDADRAVGCPARSSASDPAELAAALGQDPFQNNGDEPTAGAEAAGISQLPDLQLTCGAISTDELLQDLGEEERQGCLNESSGSTTSLTGSSDNNAEGPGAAGHGASAGARDEARAWGKSNTSANKGPGVTVNKMQEWMHKGRLLSSEMKQRIEGSSSSASASLLSGRGRGWEITGATRPDAPKPSGARAQGRGGMSPKSNPPSGGGKSSRKPLRNAPLSAQQPALIQHAQGPHHPPAGQAASSGGPGNASQPLLCRPQPLNNITVSKKRNWLQQSCHAKVQGAAGQPQGTLGVEEDGVSTSQLPAPPPCPSPDHLAVPGVPSRPLRLNPQQVCGGPSRTPPQQRSVDPAEENDADDEGEIWYNPIPEDDEPELRLLVPPPHAPRGALCTRPSRAGSEGCSAPQGPEGSEVGARPGDSVGGVSGSAACWDGSQGSAAHPSDALPPHRHFQPACREEGPPIGRAADGPDLPHNSARFSPPASPNPTKKSSSINWSFPDKIKSPRTVRKLSMKMKKLPELSRKLSVKGNPIISSNTAGSVLSEPRAHSPRTNSGAADVVSVSSVRPGLSAGGVVGQAAASRNVISRYHLDSSVSTQHSYSKKLSGGSSKSASKGGYLSDGDSPELVAKSGKHGTSEGKAGKGKETVPAGGGGVGVGGERTVGGGSGSLKLNGMELDIDAFRHYSFTEQPKCSQFISGLMSLHFYGAEDLKPPRVDSRDVYCAIQVDSVNKARTALLTCRTAFLDMDHTFNIELENAQRLKLVVFSWEPMPRRHRVCCHGTVALPSLFRVTRSHQLAVKLEPRGLIYVKLSLMEQWQNSLDAELDGEREPQVFGVEAWRVAEREATGLAVPLLIHKCIAEIEKRGCQVVGLYRLCGSAAVKKELREAFERDSYAVQLSESSYPDINVITGVLKDYLRELPYPLITKHLYETVLDSMARRPLRMGPGGCENDQGDTEHTVSLLGSLPEVERVTLRKLLDHLKLVASYQEVNKMTCQNLAVCFGPVLLSQRQEASCHTNRVFIDSEELASALHFKKHIEVLHYLLQLWPVPSALDQQPPPPYGAPEAPPPGDMRTAPPLRRRKERPQVLSLGEGERGGVLRPKAGRLDSPSNRYAGDWSYFPSEPLPHAAQGEADYDDVPSEDTEEARGEVGEEPGEGEPNGTGDRGPQLPPSPEPAAPDEGEDGEEEEGGEEGEGESDGGWSDGSGGRQLLGNEEQEEEEEGEEDRVCPHILPPPCLPREHSYQAFMKIQDISPVLSQRLNLRDLQESIDTLIGNLERELNKNKLNVGY